jgi:hypothetical protein
MSCCTWRATVFPAVPYCPGPGVRVCNRSLSQFTLNSICIGVMPELGKGAQSKSHVHGMRPGTHQFGSEQKRYVPGDDEYVSDDIADIAQEDILS